jgi:hypothetical protein
LVLFTFFFFLFFFTLLIFFFLKNGYVLDGHSLFLEYAKRGIGENERPGFADRGSRRFLNSERGGGFTRSRFGSRGGGGGKFGDGDRENSSLNPQSNSIVSPSQYLPRRRRGFFGDRRNFGNYTDNRISNYRNERPFLRNSFGERSSPRNSFEERRPPRNSFEERSSPRNSFGERRPSRNSFEERPPPRNSFENRRILRFGDRFPRRSSLEVNQPISGRFWSSRGNYSRRFDNPPFPTERDDSFRSRGNNGDRGNKNNNFNRPDRFRPSGRFNSDVISDTPFHSPERIRFQRPRSGEFSQNYRGFGNQRRGGRSSFR